MEGRNRRRGVLDPLEVNSAEISSPFAEGPTLEKFDPFSVPELPLRFRLRYFSIASASRSRMRVAIADAGLLDSEGREAG
jgi:hypothetical protein